jgi:hypothetical protein
MTFRSNIRTAEWSGPQEEMPAYLVPLEEVKRLPCLKPPKRRRTVKPGAALPLRGAALIEWRVWALGEDKPVYACRRAVV